MVDLEALTEALELNDSIKDSLYEIRAIAEMLESLDGDESPLLYNGALDTLKTEFENIVVCRTKLKEIDSNGNSNAT